MATRRACVEFVDDRGHRDAAQIAFFVVLSFIPLALLLVAACGLVLDDAEVRERVVNTVFDSVPLSQEAERERLQRALTGALEGAGDLGPLTVLILVAAATGVTSALRHAINQAWDIAERPPLLARKALDTVLALAAVLALAVSALLDLVGDLLELTFTFAVLLFLYRVLPMHRQQIGEIWPGALVATLLLALAREAIELYLEHLADFGALYGSLGALMALLVFVYAASIVVVFGAEFASEWSRLPDDDG